MSSNMERVAAMPDASLYVNRDGRRADDCVDSHGGGNLIKIPRSGGGTQKIGRQEVRMALGLCWWTFNILVIIGYLNFNQIL